MRQRAVQILRRDWVSAVVVAILVSAAWFRLTAYGDLKLSIATLDTQSYIDASRVPILSWQAFTAERLFVTNLLYGLGGASECQIQALSIPAVGKESHRQVQDCFAAVVLVQTVLSVVGWGLFVFAFSTGLASGFAKVAAALTLSQFAFAPQVADWDSVLNSESLTFSLFVLALGFLLLVLKRVRKDGMAGSAGTSSYVLAIAGLAALALWTFVRDPDVYTVVLFCLITLGALLFIRPRPFKALAGVAGLLAVCVLGLVSSAESGRWKVPLSGAYGDYVLSDPARVRELQQRGMPDPSSPAFTAWFEQHAAANYALLLLSHPRFVAATVFNNLNHLFSDNNQPYFKTPDLPLRNLALEAGDWVHARSSAVILVGVVGTVGLAIAGLRQRSSNLLGLAWFLGWLLIAGVVTMTLTFFADPAGVERHVLFSLMLLRLLMWLGLLVMVDLAIARPANDPA